ncbi:hypothetical protein K2X85_20005 [bacterium]|nr:hypothetical protein [bacterium]
MTAGVLRDRDTTLTRIGRFRWWLVSFLLILVTRFSIIDSPPYFDFALGIWREAEYLARTGFDYYSLRYECDASNTETGGPRCYMVSIVPTVLAGAYQLLPLPLGPVIAYHLVVFAASAWGMVVLYELLRRPLGKWVAVTATVSCFTTPVLCTQIDMLGFEILIITASLLWLRAIQQQKFVWAIGYALLAFAIKATGMLLAVILAFYLFVRATLGIFDKEARPARDFMLALLSLAVFGIEQGMLQWSGAFEQQQGGRLPLTMAFIWFPDVLLLSLVTVVLFAFLFAQRVGRAPLSVSDSLTMRLRDHWQREGHHWCALLVVIALSVAISNVRFVPRYAAFAVPFLYVLFAEVLASLFTSRSRSIIFVTITLVNLINWNGQLFPDPQKGLEKIAYFPGRVLRREGSLLERSHEYLAVHEENIRVTRAAADRAGVAGREGSMPVVTILPYSLYVRSPVYGVVREPSNVYSFYPVGPPRISEINSLADFENDRPRRFVAIRDTTTFNFATVKAEVLAPTASDEIITWDRLGNPDELVAYVWQASDKQQDRFPIWIARAKTVPLLAASRLWSGFQYSGGPGLVAMIQQEPTRSAWEPESLLLSSAGEARAGQWQGLLENLLKAEGRLGVLADRSTLDADLSVEDPDDDLQTALNLLTKDDRRSSRLFALRSCVKDAPFLRGVVDRYRVGLDLLNQGDTRSAGLVFRELLKSLPNFWPAELGLAQADGQEGKLPEARRRMEAIVQRVPSAWPPMVALALLIAHDDSQRAQAEELLRRYLDQYPDSPEVLQLLERMQAWSEETTSDERRLPTG